MGVTYPRPEHWPTRQRHTGPPTRSDPDQQWYHSHMSNAHIVCPRCGGDNVVIQAVTETRTKHRGCLGWALWILLAICTFGLILIIPLLTNSKTKSQTHTEAICQTCANRWRI